MDNSRNIRYGLPRIGLTNITSWVKINLINNTNLKLLNHANLFLNLEKRNIQYLAWNLNEQISFVNPKQSFSFLNLISKWKCRIFRWMSQIFGKIIRISGQMCQMWQQLKRKLETDGFGMMPLGFCALLLLFLPCRLVCNVLIWTHWCLIVNDKFKIWKTQIWNFLYYRYPKYYFTQKSYFICKLQLSLELQFFKNLNYNNPI